MNIEKEVRSALLAMDAVTAIVSARIWDEWVRSSTLPAIYMEISSERMDPALTGRGGLVLGELNILCRAETRLASRNLSEAVRVNGTSPGTGLAGYVGTFKTWLEGRDNISQPQRDGSNDYWYDTVMMFGIQWYEDI